jgi:hypothetical protein
VNIEGAAKICHESNKAYCEAIGDTSQKSWEESPDWQKASAIKGVEFHLAALNSGGKTSPAASHESWLEEKRENGWQYGPVKDPVAKLHPCFVPYDGLPLEQRAKDYVFCGIVESLFNVQMIGGK